MFQIPDLPADAAVRVRLPPRPPAALLPVRLPQNCSKGDLSPYPPYNNPTPTGLFLFNNSLRAAGFNVMKITIFVPKHAGVVEEEHPTEFSDISKK